MFKLSHPSGFTTLELWIIKDAASLEPWTWQKEAAASAKRLCVNGRSPGQGSELFRLFPGLFCTSLSLPSAASERALSNAADTDENTQARGVCDLVAEFNAAWSPAALRTWAV